MVATYRREVWLRKDDGLWHRLGRTARTSQPSVEPPFVLGVTEPRYYREGGLATDAGPFAPLNASVGDAGIAGIVPGVARTNLDISLTPINWSTPQIIQNKNITKSGVGVDPRMLVIGTDHQISNCLVLGGDDPNYVAGGGGGFIQCDAASVARLSLENVTVRPTYSNDRYDGVYGHDFTAYRCLIERTVDAFGVVNRWAPNLNARIEGCWGGSLAWYNDDRGAHADGTHNDWIQQHSGLGLTVIGSTIWGYKWNVLNPLNTSTGTTPLAYGSPNTSNRWPQIGQGFLMQTAAYYHCGQQSITENWLYGCDTAIKPASLCAIPGHAHRFNHNPEIKRNRYMNDDQRDYGGTFRFYQLRTDNAMTINGVGPYATGSVATDMEAFDPTSDNFFATSASADRKYNVDPIRRGTSIKVRCDVVV